MVLVQSWDTQCLGVRIPGVKVLMEHCEQAAPETSLTSHRTLTSNFNKLSEGGQKHVEHIY